MKVKIEGLDCPNCAKALEKHINKLDGINNATIDFFKGYINFESQNYNKAISDIIELTSQLAPEAKIITNKNKKSNKLLFIDLSILLLGIIIGTLAIFISMSPFMLRLN